VLFCQCRALQRLVVTFFNFFYLSIKTHGSAISFVQTGGLLVNAEKKWSGATTNLADFALVALARGLRFLLKPLLELLFAGLGGGLPLHTLRLKGLGLGTQGRTVTIKVGELEGHVRSETVYGQ
jgi:hypothetical protein